MSVVSLTRTLMNEQERQIAWKLLRAKNAPAIIAILDSHLGGEVRRLPVSELVNLVEIDIEELRVRADLEFKRSAQAYCDSWRIEGYLVRRPVAQVRQETYELSAGALNAISFAKRLVQPRRSATQSRLNTIIDQIGNLAVATSKNEEHRRKVLLAERDTIDEQLRQLDEGNLNLLESDDALERLQDILSLSQEIPDDFVHVRDDFELINKNLHASIINYSDGYRDVLEEIFSGVDQISQSSAGRSFKGFYSLLRNVDLAETVQDDIDAILERDYSEALTTAERRFLRGLLSGFTEQSQEVNTVMTSFARGLRRFVQSQEYQLERVLKQELDRALVMAHEVVNHYPAQKKMRSKINLTAVSCMPVSRWKLRNPTESRASEAGELILENMQPMTLEELRNLARETEIDFAELTEKINLCVDDDMLRRESALTIATVLDRFPATQGVASIVGLLVIATEQGLRHKETEVVRWRSKESVWRAARIEQWEFIRKVAM